MINVEKIKYNEPIYYVPAYSTLAKVSIIRLKANDMAVVKPFSRKKDFKPYPIPIKYIYNKAKDARIGRRNWENYMRKRKRGQKDGK